MVALVRPTEYKSVTAFGDWTLYDISDSERDSFLWARFKLMLSPDAPKKWGQRRAFKLHWNPIELRFAKHRDRNFLETHHPELYAKVELHLSLTHDRDWLLRVLTEEEIEAEIQKQAIARAMRQSIRRQKSL